MKELRIPDQNTLNLMSDDWLGSHGLDRDLKPTTVEDTLFLLELGDASLHLLNQIDKSKTAELGGQVLAIRYLSGSATKITFQEIGEMQEPTIDRDAVRRASIKASHSFRNKIYVPPKKADERTKKAIGTVREGLDILGINHYPFRKPIE